MVKDHFSPNQSNILFHPSVTTTILYAVHVVNALWIRIEDEEEAASEEEVQA